MDYGAIERLRIDPEILRRRASFLEGLARNLSEERAPYEWVRSGSIAATLKQAAQCFWYLDKTRAIRLLAEASKHYIEAGSPYGFFLKMMTIPTRSRTSVFFKSELSRLMSRMTKAEERQRDVQDRHRQFDRAMEFPTQQFYVLLASVSSTGTIREMGGSFETALSKLDSHGMHPIGPQSVPIARFLDFVRVILKSGRRELDSLSAGQSTEMVSSAIEYGMAICSRFAGSIELAQKNRYLWDRLLSPVELVDFDVAGLFSFLQTVMATREDDLQGPDVDSMTRVRKTFLFTSKEMRMSSLEQMPMMVGLDMGIDEERLDDS